MVTVIADVAVDVVVQVAVGVPHLTAEPQAQAGRVAVRTQSVSTYQQ